MGITKGIKGGLFLEQSGKILKDISYVINYTAYNYSDEGWKSLPNLELGYNLLEDFRIFSSYGISFRLPSFTELYYNTPKLKGSALLKPENGSNFELGLSYSNENYKLNASYYIRSSDNAIDWALLKGDSIYNCMNIQNMQYNGIEANLELNTNTIFSEMIYSINFGFSHISTNKTDFPYTPKYSLAFLKNKATINLKSDFSIFKSIISLRYEDRYNWDNHFLIDWAINQDFDFVNAYLLMNNLSDKSYSDIKGIPMPGRNFVFGLNFKINN